MKGPPGCPVLGFAAVLGGLGPIHLAVHSLTIINRQVSHDPPLPSQLSMCR